MTNRNPGLAVVIMIVYSALYVFAEWLEAWGT
jgi:hypothetical protein